MQDDLLDEFLFDKYDIGEISKFIKGIGLTSKNIRKLCGPVEGDPSGYEGIIKRAKELVEKLAREGGKAGIDVVGAASPSTSPSLRAGGEKFRDERADVAVWDL